MELRFRSDTKDRKKWFTKESFAHPAKMMLPLQIWLFERYTKAGEVVLDPMTGMGTALIGCAMGRNVICVELESKYIKMMENNWEKIQQVGPMMGHEMGQCRIMQGDARNLEGVLADKVITSPPFAEQPTVSRTEHGILKHPQGCKCNFCKKNRGNAGELQGYRRGIDNGTSQGQIGQLPYGSVDAMVTSPPYAETGVGDWQNPRAEFQAWVLSELRTKGHVEWQGKKYSEAEWRAMNHGRLDGRTTKGVHKQPTDGYGKAEGQIGSLPYGDVDAVVTSPPYSNRMDGGGEPMGDFAPYSGERKDWFTQRPQENIGNLRYGDVDAVITSPPYEERHSYPDAERERRAVEKLKAHPNSKIGGIRIHEHESDNPDNVGNLRGSSYLEAMLQVYSQCYKILKPNGLLILVLKNFIRNKKVVRLDLDTIKLCEQCGFKLFERHYRKLITESFWRVIYRQKYPDAETIDHEDILVFTRNGGTEYET